MNHTDETIMSTCAQVGPDGWAISPMWEFARLSAKKVQVGWKLWQRQGRYEFVGQESRPYIRDKEQTRAALGTLMALAVDIAGISADGWVRNRMGDYVPREVNKARPLRKVD